MNEVKCRLHNRTVLLSGATHFFKEAAFYRFRYGLLYVSLATRAHQSGYLRSSARAAGGGWDWVAETLGGRWKIEMHSVHRLCMVAKLLFMESV